MRRLSRGALGVGIVIFSAVLISQKLPAVLATLALAGWGIMAVVAFHLLPLTLDALCLQALLRASGLRGTVIDVVLARWVGEAANSLLPAGQIGGPVVMARYLSQRRIPLSDAAAVVTVGITVQTFAQIGFALWGAVLLGAGGPGPRRTLELAALGASAFLALQIGGFYAIQRRGFFVKLAQAVGRMSRKRDCSSWLARAAAIDAAIDRVYRRPRALVWSSLLTASGWIVGSGEVYLIMVLIQHPVSWPAALILESLGQAIRSAAFVIPGALGVQEGGYLLLAPAVGLPGEAALALALAKRARELLLAVPALLYLQHFSRGRAAAV